MPVAGLALVVAFGVSLGIVGAHQVAKGAKKVAHAITRPFRHAPAAAAPEKKN